jgi:hypothetical protein
VMNCGDRREPIFADEKDRGVVSRDARAGVRADRLAVSCLCLMHNHFHLVAETPPRKPGGGGWDGFDGGCFGGLGAE